MEPTSYKIMTFNMRNGNGDDGINSFVYRKPKILDMIRREAPDLIGFQEAVNGAREWLREKLFPEYTVIGCGRDASYRGEGVPVAFRTERFELFGLNTFWLSDHPDVPGSVYAGSDQSRYPRMAHVLLLKPRDSERVLHFINTHLDHIGPNARALAFRQLQSYIQTLPHGCILTGDFNAEPHTRELTEFMEHMKAIGWQDATTAIPPTFHDYGRVEKRLKIDYIFTDLEVEHSHMVADQPENGVYYSDHQAVCATLRLS